MKLNASTTSFKAESSRTGLYYDLQSACSRLERRHTYVILKIMTYLLLLEPDQQWPPHHVLATQLFSYSLKRKFGKLPIIFSTSVSIYACEICLTCLCFPEFDGSVARSLYNYLQEAKPWHQLIHSGHENHQLQQSDSFIHSFIHSHSHASNTTSSLSSSLTWPPNFVQLS
jgi:hypothetical protein